MAAGLLAGWTPPTQHTRPATAPPPTHPAIPPPHTTYTPNPTIHGSAHVCEGAQVQLGQLHQQVVAASGGQGRGEEWRTVGTSWLLHKKGERQQGCGSKVHGLGQLVGSPLLCLSRPDLPNGSPGSP